MKTKLKPEALLQQIAAIQEMERGKLCRMRDGANYNHQTWEKGRNVVRYVPHERKGDLQKAIAGYQRYRKLTKAYADAVIQRTHLSQKTKLSRQPVQKRPKSH
jgi:hypothetical protein